MLAFEVFLNGHKVALAGADDLAVLAVNVVASGILGPKASGTKYRTKGYGLWLSVGGLTSRKNNAPNDHLNWIGMKRLRVGDEILVRGCRVNCADPPTEVRPEDPKRSERAEREEFKWVKARYVKLRKKYEKPRAR